jgi:TatD DNase family protein
MEFSYSYLRSSAPLTNMYFDMHCHLDDEAFKETLPTVLEKAKQAGVKAIISNGTGTGSNQAVKALCEQHPLVRPAYGLYPTYDMVDATELAWIREQALHGTHPPVAIGEIGLDGVNGVTDEQRIRFRAACQLAQELRLPVIIHSRKAEQDVFHELENLRIQVPIVMHCFGGSKKLIEEGIKRRYYFSIPATINRATHFQMMATMVPLSQLLTETDSPYLYPVAFPNEPANVVQTVEHIATLKGMTVEECRSILFMSFQRLFSGVPR